MVDVLVIQGLFSEHLECFKRCPENIQLYEIRSGSQPTHVGIQGLVIPRGESTTMKMPRGWVSGKLLKYLLLSKVI